MTKPIQPPAFRTIRARFCSAFPGWRLRCNTDAAPTHRWTAERIRLLYRREAHLGFRAELAAPTVHALETALRAELSFQKKLRIPPQRTALSVLPGCARVARSDYDGVPTAASAARAWVARTSSRWGREFPKDLALVVSELVTNAVAHTRSGNPGGKLSVRLLLSPDRIRVEVRDAGPLHGHTPTVREAGLDTDGGRGLFLVNALSDQWGQLTTGHGVFAEIDL